MEKLNWGNTALLKLRADALSSRRDRGRSERWYYQAEVSSSSVLWLCKAERIHFCRAFLQCGFISRKATPITRGRRHVDDAAFGFEVLVFVKDFDEDASVEGKG